MLRLDRDVTDPRGGRFDVDGSEPSVQSHFAWTTIAPSERPHR
jgi:hypothetical protein